MDLQLFDYVLIITGGFLAGVINTLAGFGSIITLSIYMELIGLPAIVANATNRVNILAMNASSSLVFYQNKMLNIGKSWHVFVALILGALIGVYMALEVSNEQFRGIFRYLLILCLLVVIIKPSRLINSSDAFIKLPRWLIMVFFFIAGIYGGFIQMGIGVFILILTVSLTKLNLIQSNAFKTFSIGVYTLVVLSIFWYKGLINWQAGILLAITQSAGGALAARFASNNENASTWAYRLLILVIIVALVKAFFF